MVLFGSGFGAPGVGTVVGTLTAGTGSCVDCGGVDCSGTVPVAVGTGGAVLGVANEVAAPGRTVVGGRVVPEVGAPEVLVDVLGVLVVVVVVLVDVVEVVDVLVVVDVVVDVDVVDVDVVEVVVVLGGSGGPVTRGSPMYSKCMPSAIGNVPPHAKPCRRNTSTMRSSIVGVAPYALVLGLMSKAPPQLWREMLRPLVPLADRMRRGFQHPPARRVSQTSINGARPACSISANTACNGLMVAR